VPDFFFSSKLGDAWHLRPQFAYPFLFISFLDTFALNMDTTPTDLEQLPTETVLAEIGRLQNSNKHLVRSISEMQEFDPELNDTDLKQAVMENEQVISRQQEQISKCIVLIRQRLGDHAAQEIESTVEDYRKKDEDLVNGSGVFL
jgi:hypothetical protein